METAQKNKQNISYSDYKMTEHITQTHLVYQKVKKPYTIYL